MFCAGAWFASCAEIPGTPSLQGKATEIAVYVLQRNNEDSTILKINATESATLKAQVRPDNHESELTFFWYDEDDFLLGDGSTFFIENPIIDDIPSRVVAKDKEGNTLEKALVFNTNTPPRVGSTFYPEDGEIFTISKYQTVTFKWYYTDLDDDSVECFLYIDDQVYNVGALTQVAQSGFTPGNHKFHIEVVDSYGDKSSTPERSFTVKDSTEDP